MLITQDLKGPDGVLTNAYGAEPGLLRFHNQDSLSGQREASSMSVPSGLKDYPHSCYLHPSKLSNCKEYNSEYQED